MSVRIHQLSKKIGMENKELIALLTERGFNVKSPASTIDNISAESLIEEYSVGQKETDEKETSEPLPQAGQSSSREQDGMSESKEIKERATAEESPESKGASLPAGVFVKSVGDIEREREEKIAAKNAPAPSAPSSSSRPAHAAPVNGPPPVPRGPSTVQPPRAAPPAAKSPPAPPVAKSPPAPPAAKSPPSSPGNRAPSQPPSLPGMTPSSSSEKEKAADALPAEKPEKEPAGDEPEAPSKEAEPVEEEVKALQLKPPIVVRDFAVQLGLKPFRLISELMEMGIFASMNQVIDENIASDIAAKYGFILDIRHRGEPAAAPEKKVKEVVKVDESKFLEPRPPVVCILGHVDHGKTTLLDSIRKASVVSGEAGGITQHIGAYQIEVNDQKITFLDTPGHAAFTKMRARGADVTDVAILLVAADDGFMPQTDEALKHAQSAGVPIIVAINKTDTKGANVERVKKQMQERNIAPEDWGGEIITVPVSAIKGEGVDELLEMILLQAEVSELKANPKAPAEGVIIEAEVEVGRGPSATVIIQKGTLKTGDALVCGRFYGKARALYDDQGKIVKKAPPSMPVRVIGWSDAPEAGALFQVVKNEKEARRIAEENQELQRKDGIAQVPVAPAPTIENLFDAIASTKKKTFRTVLRCDVQGSLEAVRGMLENIESDKVDIDVIQADVGPISQSDVLMASTSQAAIIGFGVKVEPGVVKFAKHHGVKIFQHNIIYELLDQVKDGMADLLEPELHEKKLGAAEIRQVFPVGKGTVAGCLVTEGKITRDAKARLLRKGEEVFDSSISTLKRFKEDAKDVRAGYECGIALTRFSAYEPGDIIECYEIQKKRGSL